MEQREVGKTELNAGRKKGRVERNHAATQEPDGTLAGKPQPRGNI